MGKVEPARLLLDTHALLWWYSDDPALPPSTRKAIAYPANNILVSAASAWEIAIKFRIGKLASASEVVQNFDGDLERCGFVGLPISPAHSIRAGLLPGPLRDPFDRMLIAQTQAEGLVIVSNEKAFDRYGIRRVW